MALCNVRAVEPRFYFYPEYTYVRPSLRTSSDDLTGGCHAEFLWVPCKVDQLVPFRGEDCSMLSFPSLALYVQPLGRSAVSSVLGQMVDVVDKV